MRVENTPFTAQKPTVSLSLAKKLGREPTNAELRAEVGRILDEVATKLAEASRLPHQRKR